MKLRFAELGPPAVVGRACAEPPAAPRAEHSPAIRAQKVNGTGLVLTSVTGLSLPLIGQLGNVTIDQAEITDFAVIENTVGQIVGLEANGVLQLTGGVLGSQVVSEDFNTTVAVLVAQVDVPAATLTAQSSGVVGSLLCNLGQALQGLTSSVPSLVSAINGQIRSEERRVGKECRSRWSPYH